CQPREQFIEPDVDIPYDTYRSFNRGKRSGKQSSQENTTSK
ncbi:MAG: tRNA (guanosine(46)-N7)-methyltransferase TrmB, partial [Barnesiella intestinihominis]